MKHLNMIIICVFAVLVLASCKKQPINTPENPTTLRKVKFVLYTDKDLSTDNSTVVFKPFIEKTGGEILWDTTLAPIKIKDIPNALHKLSIEHTLADKDNSTLKVGFGYSIENVGNSRFFDSINTGETFKEIAFNFR